MTELATPPVAGAHGRHEDQPLDRRPQRRRHVGPQRPGLQPRDRPPDRRARPRHRRGGRPGGAGREGGVRDVAHGVAREARRALLQHPRARARAPRRGREDPHRRARQGALRRDGRGDARARGDRVLLRPPDASEERVLRAGVDRHRRLLDPPAARRRRRASRRSTSRRWCRCGCGRRRSRPATRSC